MTVKNIREKIKVRLSNIHFKPVFNPTWLTGGIFIVLVALIGTVLLVASHANTSTASIETESGSASNGADIVNDGTASGSKAVTFNQQTSGGTGGNVVNVSSAAQLTAALASAQPGDVITLADGTYSGDFNSTKSGTVSAPITITGSRDAILDGGKLTGGYTLSLGTKDTATSIGYWKVEGFTVTGGQKGIIFDNVQHSSIHNVLVQQIGEEGIHLRDDSSNNLVSDNTITKTGQDTEAYGEGVYVGSAISNWKAYAQDAPDHSNGNQIIGNTISYTGAENMDIKEGTHGGTISDNHFDGHGMCWDTGDDCNYADSFIDMKGEGWTVSNNTGTYMHVTWKSGTSGNVPPTNDGFQDHVITTNTKTYTVEQFSGSNDTFSSNQVSDVAGVGFNIQSKATGVKVLCNNTVTSAGSGFGFTCVQN